MLRQDFLLHENIPPSGYEGTSNMHHHRRFSVSQHSSVDNFLLFGATR
jgi:hypothetical protein